MKKALKSAISVSIGTTVGTVLLPRMMFSQLYNNTYPPIWQQALLCFVVSYGVGVVVLLLIEWVRNKAKNEPKDEPNIH